MRAAVLRRTGEALEIVDGVGLVPLEANDVRVAVRATGLCHSDLHGIDGDLGNFGQMVLGHEGAGEVVEVGSAITGLSVGDHVVLVWCPPCGECIACVDQRSPHLCTRIQFDQAMRRPFVDGDRRLYAMSGIGSFAEEVLCPAECCVGIDADVPWEVASLVGCAVSTGVGAVFNAARVGPGDSCVVIGCGGVGMSVVQGCRLAGASTILAIDPQPAKLDLARDLGATHATTPDALAEVTGTLTGEAHGFDHAFEVVGRSETVRAAYDAARRGGTVVVVGVGGANRTVELNLLEVFFDEKTLRGSYYGSADPRGTIPQLLRLWRAGRLDLEAMISERIGLDEVNGAIDKMRRGETVRVVITP